MFECLESLQEGCLNKCRLENLEIWSIIDDKYKFNDFRFSDEVIDLDVAENIVTCIEKPTSFTSPGGFRFECPNVDGKDVDCGCGHEVKSKITSGAWGLYTNLFIGVS